MEQQKINYQELMNRERVIHIPDLISYILEKIWVVILLAALCSAVLTVHKYQAGKSASLAESPETAASIGEKIARLEGALTEEELSEVKTALSLQDSVEQQTEYLSRSVYMNLDSLSEDRVTMTYHIDGDGGTDFSELSELYDNYINHGGLVTDLQNAGVDLEAQYLSELIWSNADATSQIGTDSAGFRVEDTSGCLNIYVVHESQKKCEALADQVQSCLQAFHDSAVATGGEHDFVLLDRYYAPTVDKELWSKVDSYTGQLSNINSRLTATEDDMSDDQASLLQAYQDKEEVDPEEDAELDSAATVVPNPVPSKKYMAVGALAGAVVGIFLLAVWYVLKGTVNCVQELRLMYNLRVLGEVGKRKGLLAKKQTMDEQLDLLMANLRSARALGENNRVLLLDAKPDSEWVAGFCERLEQAGAKPEVVTEINSPQTYQKISGCGQAILCVAMRKTLHAEVKDRIRFCLEQEAGAPGVIAVY